MNDSGRDVDAILEYRSAARVARMLPMGLLLIFLGLLLAILVDADSKPSTGDYIGITAVLLTGSAVIGLALWRRLLHGKPVFTLSPEGIHYRIPWLKDVLIPWREIQGVDTINIVTTHWSPVWLFVSYPITQRATHTMAFGDVPVVLVSKQFYESRIFAPWFLLHGPGWKKANIIPKGALVQIALHPTLVSVEPRALRQAVEDRWLAFRDQPSAASPRSSVPSVNAAGHSITRTEVAPLVSPKSNVVAMGDAPRAISRWEAVKIIVPLIGIAVMSANLAGFWQLPGQREAREARAKAREARQQREEEARRRLEESKKREAEEQERRRQLDELRRRMFNK
jgi:hypothetical protein